MAKKVRIDPVRDPVTCARNFDHMVQLFFKDVLKSKAMPVGEIEEFFYRVEFQQRGSPHIHALLWVKKAPQYGVNSDNDVIKFVTILLVKMMQHVVCQS